jgi:hypothetical protein
MTTSISAKTDVRQGDRPQREREHTVAHELKPLIARTDVVLERGMSHRLKQELVAMEAIAEVSLEGLKELGGCRGVWQSAIAHGPRDGASERDAKRGPCVEGEVHAAC